MEMKGMTKNEALFEIQLTGLAVGEHEYSFIVDKGLFEIFENDEIKKASVEVIVKLTISPNVKELDIELNGEVEVLCDRCLEPMILNVVLSEHTIVKPQDGNTDSDLNILEYDASIGALSLDQYIYDMIITGMPMQKVHPEDESGNPTCDPAMMDLLENENEDLDNEIDPRWDQLRNLI